MSEENIYDEIEIEDMTYDAALQTYTYPCPCGDRFQITIDDLRDGEEIAVCPSCSLMIRVIFDVDDLPKAEEEKAAAIWRAYGTRVLQHCRKSTPETPRQAATSERDRLRKFEDIQRARKAEPVLLQVATSSRLAA
ncbi:hypothetical protein Q7P35_006470 [Cladosporium inversicolor]